MVVPDPERRRPGRGAWLHPDVSCLDLAVRRKAFGRALRSGVGPDVSLVAGWVEGLSQGRPTTEAPEPEAGLNAMSTR